MPRLVATTDAFSALADGHRRAILDALGDREASVNELVARLHLPQPQVSKHLGVLRRVDLVRCRKAGRRRLYRVNGRALAPVHQWLEGFSALWNDRLDRLDDVLTELQSRPDHEETTR